MKTFSAHLCDAIRGMPDEALVALVHSHVSVLAGAATGDIRALGQATTSARVRPQVAARQKLMARVEGYVNRSQRGLSLSDVYVFVGGSKHRLKGILRELARTNRIKRAGDRKFARYARTLALAAAASNRARGRG